MVIREIDSIDVGFCIKNRHNLSHFYSEDLQAFIRTVLDLIAAGF